MLACIFGLDALIVRLVDLPFAVKCLVILAIIAPVSMALGMPFPMGIGGLRGEMASFLPQAWAINGAFSVISSPLASILAVSLGYTWVFATALLLYPLAVAVFPGSAVCDDSRKGS